MEQIINNLTYIHNVLQGDNYKQYRPIMIVILSETIEEVRKQQFVYYVNFGTEQTHVGTYKAYCKMNKYKLIADLEEIEMILRGKTVNIKRCIVLLEDILKSNLYQQNAQRKVSRWQHVNPKAVINQTKIHVNQ
ncbi:hypothetical protein [Cytobacillus kochii]|uniref:Uncharacterized protein n=1 Tax=Cytobacillus kochii TaxID=859143 RepID=A0A248TLG0_9BACI|nr:hypothetical protein [Cytobacillus kochii]ASV69068.1 hypothetical protein CKF48_18245 [Cytobacillus kochii]